MKLVLLLTFLGVFDLVAALSTSSYFNKADREHAKRLLLEAFSSEDVASIHYGALGLTRLKEKLPSDQPTKQCIVISKAAADPKANAETFYHAAIAHKVIRTCPQALPVLNIVKTLNAFIAKETNLQEIFYAVQGLTALGQKPADVAQLVKAVQAILKKNDSLLNFGYFFHICASLGAEGKFAFDRIEDAIVQADEVDQKFLQFEGGLSTTALIFNGAYKLANIVSKSPPISNDQAVKFANYFLSRKSVQTAKGITNLLLALNNLATNTYQIPVAITLASNAAISSDNPAVSVKVSNILGDSLGALTVTADSGTRIVDDVIVLSKKKFESSSDNTVFNLNILESKPEKGQYKLTISAALSKADPRIPSTVSSTVTIKVLSAAVIEFVDIGTVDADQTTQGKLTRVQFPKSADKPIDGDAQQKIQMRFNVKDKATNKLITVHQAFLRLYRKNSLESVTFIAEPDSNTQYKLDLDLGAKSAEFNHISGDYEAELIIGDAVLSNSFSWKIAELKLKFSSEPRIIEDQNTNAPKPEIKHLFREPEVRPARVVSDLFTILTALPLLLLFILWARLRINVSNITLSVSTLVFHVSLGGIFLLFALFWLRLNMFETVRYLFGIGIITFLSGNRLLRHIAANKK